MKISKIYNLITKDMPKKWFYGILAISLLIGGFGSDLLAITGFKISGKTATEQTTPAEMTSFEKVWATVCYIHYKGNETAQRQCINDIKIYQKSINSGKYNKSCADISAAVWEYQSYLNESRSYGMSDIAQEEFLALNSIRVIAPKYNCNVLSWTNDFEQSLAKAMGY